MTFGPSGGNVGMYVAREMLEAVPEDQRTISPMVERISDLKYQLGVEVARQLPRLLAQSDPELVARYLTQVTAVAKLGWRSGVEVAKQLPDLYEAPDKELADNYVDIIEHATTGTAEDAASMQLSAELAHLEREIQEMEPKVKRAQELRTQLGRQDRRDEKRKSTRSSSPPRSLRCWPPAAQAPRRVPRQVSRSPAPIRRRRSRRRDTLSICLNGERVSHDGATEWVNRGLGMLERNKGSVAATSAGLQVQPRGARGAA